MESCHCDLLKLWGHQVDLWPCDLVSGVSIVVFVHWMDDNDGDGDGGDGNDGGYDYSGSDEDDDDNGGCDDDSDTSLQVAALSN